MFREEYPPAIGVMTVKPSFMHDVRALTLLRAEHAAATW